MTALVGKIKDTFSNIMFDIELFFDKIFHRSKKSQFSVRPPDVQSARLQPSAIQPTPQAKTVVEEKKQAKPAKLSFSLKTLRMSTKDRLFFYDQMSTLIGSGVTLIDSLSLVFAQTNNKGLKKLYKEMIHDINTGMSLADSMYKFSHIFPRMQAALIEAGEKSGNLKTVLSQIAEEMDSDQDFKRKITAAMFYPLILLGMSILLVVGMMIFVIPKISGMYIKADASLPVLTQTIINMSNYIINNWLMLLICTVGGIVFLYLFFSKLRFGKMFWEKIISIIPIAGRISKEKNLMIISSNMSMLMKSGVLISEAFEITEKTVNNLHYKRELSKIRQGVIMGKEVSEIMGLIDVKEQKFKQNKLFPLQFAQLMHIGETTGKIAEMLEKLKTNYHKSIENKLKNISTIVEPVMIFIISILVGSILLAIMLPLFDASKLIT